MQAALEPVPSTNPADISHLLASIDIIKQQIARLEKLTPQYIEEAFCTRDRALVAREKRCAEIEALLTTQKTKKFVTLNIGGTKFSTSRSTLTAEPSSMLGGMFSGRFPLEESEDGSVFIDRSGTYFGIILDWLRTNKLPSSLQINVLEALETEADFYQLPQLLSALKLEIASRQVAVAPPARRSPVHFRLNLSCGSNTAVLPHTHAVCLKIISNDPKFVQFEASQSLQNAVGTSTPAFSSVTSFLYRNTYVALQRVFSAHYRIELFECLTNINKIGAMKEWSVTAAEDAYIAYPLPE